MASMVSPFSTPSGHHQRRKRGLHGGLPQGRQTDEQLFLVVQIRLGQIQGEKSPHYAGHHSDQDDD